MISLSMSDMETITGCFRICGVPSSSSSNPPHPQRSARRMAWNHASSSPVAGLLQPWRRYRRVQELLRSILSGFSRLLPKRGHCRCLQGGDHIPRGLLLRFTWCWMSSPSYRAPAFEYFEDWLGQPNIARATKLLCLVICNQDAPDK